MNKKQELGKKGELAAVEYLLERGHKILHLNFRCRAGEIDIISYADDTLHFVEVKTRSGVELGRPAESVNGAKMRRIMRTAEAYLMMYPKFLYCNLQMDVIEVLCADGEAEINLLERAFYQEEF